MVSVVLLMAGTGSRMQQKENKILLMLGGKPLYAYPLQTFYALGAEIVCVIAKADEEKIKPKLPRNVKIAYGGRTRQESVENGLKLCSNDYVMIHDAARPFIDKYIILDIMNHYRKDEAVLVYQNVKDTIKLKEADSIKTLPRSSLISAATPQCASREIFTEVYQRASADGYEATDDISLIERYKPEMKIKLVLGNEENFKVTTPIDYKLAKIIAEEIND